MNAIVTVDEEEAELAAVREGCQSTSHGKTACSGFLWECVQCHRLVCCTDGEAGSDLCDECWAESEGGSDAWATDYEHIVSYRCCQQHQ